LNLYLIYNLINHSLNNTAGSKGKKLASFEKMLTTNFNITSKTLFPNVKKDRRGRERPKCALFLFRLFASIYTINGTEIKRTFSMFRVEVEISLKGLLTGSNLPFLLKRKELSFCFSWRHSTII
jgi:hypothetical protein